MENEYRQIAIRIIRNQQNGHGYKNVLKSLSKIGFSETQYNNIMIANWLTDRINPYEKKSFLSTISPAAVIVRNHLDKAFLTCISEEIILGYDLLPISNLSTITY